MMRLTVSLLLIAAMSGAVKLQQLETREVGGPVAQIAPTDCAEFLPYSSNPDHIWNRTQFKLLVRTAPDGTQWGCDEVDPLLWFETKHVLGRNKYPQTAELLDEFIATHAELLVDDPVKRALFQRNLWAVFLWLNEGTTVERERDQLERRIAAIIKSVALTDEEIGRLPHNFTRGAGTVDGLQFPEEGQGWLLISRDDKSPAALAHAASSPRSAFLVYLKLPVSSHTVRYVEKLRQFSLARTDQHCDEHPCSVPQFPLGTEVALVRRALLIDTTGRAVVSPITESVQLRKYVAIDPNMPVFVHRSGDQKRAEFRLSQRALLESKPSLRRVAEDESEFPVFATQGADAFEQRSNPVVRAFTSEKPFGPRGAIVERCVACHSMPGVISFTTYSRSHFVAPGEPMFVLIHAASEEQEIAKQISALSESAGWKKLQVMMRDLR
jgi:hypothetical protein